MATYKIESIQTKYFIVSDGTEQDGDLVTTLDGSVCVPSDSVGTLRLIPRWRGQLIVYKGTHFQFCPQRAHRQDHYQREGQFVHRAGGRWGMQCPFSLVKPCFSKLEQSSVLVWSSGAYNWQVGRTAGGTYQ